MPREKVVVYPYDSEFAPVIRHKELLKDYFITNLVSPSGWGLKGKDAGKVDKGNEVNINVSSDFEKALENCDTVWFTEHYNYLDYEKNILPKIYMAIDQNKNIIYTMDSDKERIQEISSLCKEKNVKFISNASLNRFRKDLVPSDEKIFKIDTPVVFVAGTFEKTHKFEIQLALREKLLEQGYNVSQIGTREYCELLGFHSFPGFMNNTNIPEYKKILLFNHYVKKIEVEEQPDIIIMGLPGAMTSYNNDFTCKFGLYAFEISQAVQPDFVIVSLLQGEYDQRFFEQLSNLARYRFNFDIDCFNIANIDFDINMSITHQHIEYISVDLAFIDKIKARYKNLKTPVFNIMNSCDAENLANTVIDKLSGYGEVGKV